MNFRQLKSLVILSEELSFSRAAERLHVAQPALSQQIRTFEQQLGTELFDRSMRPLRLTAAGLHFCSEAHQILRSYEQAKESARQIGEGKRARLSIGFIRSAICSVLTPALKDFHKTYPAVELKLFEMSVDDQMNALRDNQIQVSIGREEQVIPGCASIQLLQERLMAVLPLDHPMANGQVVRVDELEALPFIQYPKNADAYLARYVRGLYLSAGLTLHAEYVVDDFQAAFALVAAGLGVSFAGDSVIGQSRTDIVFRPIIGLDEAPTIPLVATFRVDGYARHIDDFVSLLVPIGLTIYRAEVEAA